MEWGSWFAAQGSPFCAALQTTTVLLQSAFSGEIEAKLNSFQASQSTEVNLVPGGEIYSRHSQGHRENNTNISKLQY